MRRPVLVLGGGLAGMSAAWPLQGDATVLERASRPGGLVRTVEIDGYWFDHVIHLLYFRDSAVAERVTPLLGDRLAPRPPRAFVVTEGGVARYPIQLRLGDLDASTCAHCLHDLARAQLEADPSEGPAHYDAVLRRSFGDALYDLFFGPYNAKMWKRDLTGLAPVGFQWNLHQPDLLEAIRGGLDPDAAEAAYNAGGVYPQSRPGDPVRGMEHLSDALAGEVDDLRLDEEVIAIDPAAREVRSRCPAGARTWSWSHALVSTLPLPTTLALCEGVPPALQRSVQRLPRNGVASVAIRVQGPRPDRGMWRYYPDPSLCFTRLVFLHEFDPALAPHTGWPLLVEVPFRAEEPPDLEALVDQVLADVHACGELPPGSTILGADVLLCDPAYVVFELGADEIIQQARAWLAERGVHTLGRYGRWEYSSMAGVIGDGLRLGDALRRELDWDTVTRGPGAERGMRHA